MRNLPFRLSIGFVFFYFFSLTGLSAQSPGILTIIDQRNCDDTLFFSIEAEPLANPPCGGPMYGLTNIPIMSGNTLTFDFKSVSAPATVRWIAATFYPTQAIGCDYIFSPPTGVNFAQMGPCPTAQYFDMIPNCPYYDCDKVKIHFKVTYLGPGSMTILIN